MRGNCWEFPFEIDDHTITAEEMEDGPEEVDGNLISFVFDELCVSGNGAPVPTYLPISRGL